MSMLRKAMHYLGLAPDDEYDEEYAAEEPATPVARRRADDWSTASSAQPETRRRAS